MSSEPLRLQILATAHKVTGGDRHDSYGPVHNNLSNIAKMFTAYLNMRYRVNVTLTSEDSAWLLTLVKMARSASGKMHTDNYVDAAAYAAIAGECREADDRHAADVRAFEEALK